jgi:hypothetical protein
MTTFYKKQGRRYVPVSEYDSEFHDSIREGTHLVVSRPGYTSRRFNVEPALAPMIAAGYIAEEKISKVIMDELAFKPEHGPLTPAQLEAWENYKQAMGDSLCRLSSNSIMNAVRAGVNEMVKESSKLMEYPSVKNSYDQFVLLSKLVSENKE